MMVKLLKYSFTKLPFFAILWDHANWKSLYKTLVSTWLNFTPIIFMIKKESCPLQSAFTYLYILSEMEED